MSFDYLNSFRPMMMVNHLLQVYAALYVIGSEEKEIQLIPLIYRITGHGSHLHKQSDFRALVNVPSFHRMTIVWMPVKIGPFDRAPWEFALVQFAAIGKFANEFSVGDFD